MRISSILRFVGTVLGLVLIVGCASLVLGAFDKSQTDGQAGLLNLGALLHYNAHFLQQTVGILTTARDSAGTPFRTYLFIGFGTTLEFCFIAMPVALVLGMMLALMSHAHRPILRLPARAYVEFFRNTPLLVQMLAIYYALTLPHWLLTPFTAGVATLVLNYAAYECENMRAGIEALDRGQGEAAAALGLSYWQTLRLVTIPQMVSIVLPPVVNDVIYMYKDSAILSLITVTELTNQIRDLTRRNPSVAWQVYLVGAALYLVLSLPLARVARSVEVRLKSATFVPKGDLSVVALQALGAMVGIGWLCGVLVQGLTLRNLAGSAAQLLAAVGLALAIMAFMLLVPGALVFAPASLVRLVRRQRLRARRAGAAVAVPR